MTQLIIDGVTLPKSSNDNYRCYPSELATTLDMISGRRTKEVRGFVWKIEWGYDQLDDAVWRQLEKTLRGGGSFPVAFLPDQCRCDVIRRISGGKSDPSVLWFCRQWQSNLA